MERSDTKQEAVVGKEVDLKRRHTLIKLWGKAKGMLTRKEADSLEKYGATYQSVKGLLDKATNSCNTNLGPKSTAVRDIEAKIVKPLKSFIAVVDQGVALDASGHAALPWAVIKFILQPFLDDYDEYVAVKDGMETITNVICYSQHLEALYLDETSGVTAELQKSLVAAYHKTLKFLSDAMKYFDGNKFKNFFTSWLGPKNKFKDMIEDVKGGMTEVTGWTRLADRESLKDIGTVAKRIEQFVTSVWEQQEDKKILQWISPVPCIVHHADLSSARLHDSALWILKDKEYANWRNCPNSSILWLHGGIGMGKSTLVSVVIDSYLSNLRPVESDPVVFFYCKRDQHEDRRQDPAEILRSIVRQLICLKSNIKIGESVRRYYKDGIKLSIYQSVKLMEDTELMGKLQSLTVVIDALDECRDSETSSISEVITKLKTLMTNPRCLLRVFISSQKTKKMELLINSENCPVFSIDADKTAAASRFFSLPIKTPGEDFKQIINFLVKKRRAQGNFLTWENPEGKVTQNVINTLIEKAGGMFLWVNIKLDKLCMGSIKDEGDVQNELDSGAIPEDSSLDLFYKTSYEDAIGGGSSGPVAEKAIKLLFCCMKQLTANTFLEVVFDLDERPKVHKAEYAQKLLENCCGLVIWDKAMDVFRFTHPSLVEYFEQKKDFVVDSHAKVAEICLVHLRKVSDKKPSRGRSSAREADDPEAAARRSSRSSSRPSSRDSSSDGKAGGGGRSSGKRDLSDDDMTESYYSDRKGSTAGRPLQNFHNYATLFWPTHFKLSRNSNQHANMESYDTSGRPVRGHQSRKTAEVEFIQISDPKRFPGWASDVQSLFSQHTPGYYNSQVETQIAHCLSKSAVSQFLGCAYGFPDLIKSRDLHSIANPKQEEERNEKGLTSLHVASKFGHEEVVRKLLEKEASLLHQDREGKTALHHAVENANGDEWQGLLKLLLEKSAVTEDVFITAVRNPIYAVELLRIIFYEKDGKDEFCTTTEKLLQAAVGNGEKAESLIAILLDDDVEDGDPPVTDEILLAAVVNPFCTHRLLKTLLESNTKIAEKVLVTAAKYSNKQMTRDPLTKLVNRSSWTNRVKVWEALLSRGGRAQLSADVLRAAVIADDKELVEFLLNRGENYEGFITSDIVESAVASRQCPKELVTTLLASSTVKSTGRMLNIALKNLLADKALIKALYTHGADGSPKVSIEALKIVVENGNKGKELLQFLFEFATQQKLELEISEEVIGVAATSGNMDVLKLLLTQRKELAISKEVFRAIMTAGKNESDNQWGTMVESKKLFPGNANQFQGPELDFSNDIRDSLMRDITQLLVERGVISKDLITNDIIESAVLCQGPKLVGYLLDHAVDPIAVSPTIMDAAIGNKVYGNSVLGLLSENGFLGKDDSNLLQTEGARVLAGAKGSLETVSFVFGELPSKITSDVLRAAAKNPDVSVLNFFLSTNKGLPAIDNVMLQAAAENSDAALQALLGQPYLRLTLGITVEIVLVVAQNCQWIETMDLLLDLAEDAAESLKHGDSHLCAAARNPYGIDMLVYLFENVRHSSRRNAIVTENLLAVAARNPSFAPEMLRVCFDHCSTQILSKIITTNVLEKAADNGAEAPEALRVLLEELNAKEFRNKVVDSVWEAAAGNTVAPEETLRVLMEVSNRLSVSQWYVGKDVLNVAKMNPKIGASILKELTEAKRPRATKMPNR